MAGQQWGSSGAAAGQRRRHSGAGRQGGSGSGSGAHGEHEEGVLARRVVWLLAQVDGGESRLAPELEERVGTAKGGAQVVEAACRQRNLTQPAEQRRQRGGGPRRERLAQCRMQRRRRILLLVCVWCGGQV